MTDDDTANAAEIAKWIGATERTVRDLAGREILIRAETKGRYRLRASVVNYISYLREVAAGRGSATGAGGRDLVEERTRVAKAQADFLEIRNDEKLGTVAPIDVMVEHYGEGCARIRSGMRAIPSSVAAQLATMRSPPEIHAFLLKEIDHVLTELSTDKKDEQMAKKARAAEARAAQKKTGKAGSAK